MVRVNKNEYKVKVGSEVLRLTTMTNNEGNFLIELNDDCGDGNVFTCVSKFNTNLDFEILRSQLKEISQVISDAADNMIYM